MTSKDNTVSSDDLIWTERSQKALEALESALSGQFGIVVATSAAGMGKTTLIDRWARRNAEKATIVSLNPVPSTQNGLLSGIANAFRFSPKTDDVAGFLNAARLFLGDEDAAGRASILVIDSADGIDEAGLTAFYCPARPNFLIDCTLQGRARRTPNLSQPSRSQA